MGRNSLLAGLFVLGACAQSITLAPAGKLQPEALYSVSLTDSWSHYPDSLNVQTRGSILTKDGLILNRVHMLSLKNGETLLKVAKTEEAPVYRTGMSALEQVELLTSSLSRMGYERLETQNIRPQTFDGAEGTRLAFTGQLASGLNIQGDAALVEYDDAFNLMIFIAPQQHYFGVFESEIDAMIASIDL